MVPLVAFLLEIISTFIMKTQPIMLIKIFLVVISLTSCLESTSQSVSTSKKVTKTVAKPTAKAKTAGPVKKPAKGLQNNNFGGNYVGSHNGSTISVQLLSKGTGVSGTFIMNGQQAKINGTVNNLICKGRITEDETNISYDFAAEKTGADLQFSLLYPGQSNQGVKLLLKKESATGISNVGKNSGKSRNPALIGTWRNTEVISSGSGQFYSSFSTDYFIKLNADGTALIWTGKSAGGTKNVTIDAPQGSNVQRAEWYTEGKSLIFADPNTGQKEGISFYAEPSRMMLTGKNSKKVYQRVN